MKLDLDSGEGPGKMGSISVGEDELMRDDFMVYFSFPGQSVHICHVQLPREEGGASGAAATGRVHCGLH